MNFSQSEFFDSCDILDAKTTDELLSLFRKQFVQDFGSDMYDFIEGMDTGNAVLLFMIAKRLMDSTDLEV